ncbi:MAG: hypothetical protein AB7I23_07740 [Vicinamibacterales bacterium]
MSIDQMMAGSATLLVAVLLAVVTVGAGGVRADQLLGPAAAGPIDARDPVLRDALARIARGSASWRSAMTAVAATGRRAVVLTPADVLILPDGATAPVPFDTAEVAGVAPLADAGGAVSVVVVVVNVAALEAAHERRGSLPAEFHGDLDRVLAHEVYGHAVPYLLAGHLGGRCGDPEPGQPAADACAIKRENLVRAELRLGRRTDRALMGLDLSRALYWR